MRQPASPRSPLIATLCLLSLALTTRADDAPPEPTPDTARGAIKLFCHRLAACDYDGALALCAADTSDDDKALIKSAIDCYKAYADLRKAAADKFGGDALTSDKYALSGPKPPTDSYIDGAKETPSTDDPTKMQLAMNIATPPLTAIKDGNTWRVIPTDILRSASWNRSDPADCYATFTEYAKQAAQDVADGKFATLQDLTRDLSRRRSEYSRSQSEKRRKGGL